MLVLVIFLTGILLALPNIYGTAPAVQLANVDGDPISEAQLANFVRSLESDDIIPEAAYISDGRAVIRFAPGEFKDQQRSGERLRSRYEREARVALTLAPRLPDWVRNMGLTPMSLGLDLRGGVYVLLEVDMDTAIDNRMQSYQQDFDERLRDLR